MTDDPPTSPNPTITRLNKACSCYFKDYWVNASASESGARFLFPNGTAITGWYYNETLQEWRSNHLVRTGEDDCVLYKADEVTLGRLTINGRYGEIRAEIESVSRPTNPQILCRSLLGPVSGRLLLREVQGGKGKAEKEEEKQKSIGKKDLVLKRTAGSKAEIQTLSTNAA